ncbi:MAG: hypothetical protein SFU25_06470, partial [Candidatus Caenarcaniphilales bacterium]|nr:hypothetical protein [Candidatus Caenarcaniphilales bacterium]
MPANLDLAQIYFGEGDELGFIRNSVEPRIQTILQSSEYINLQLSGLASHKEQDVLENQDIPQSILLHN